MGGAAVHFVLLITLMVLSVEPNKPQYLGPLLVISVLWGLGTALNKTGCSSKYHLWLLCLGYNMFAHHLW